MPSLQIHDILGSLRSFYGRLAERFEQLEAQATGEQLPYLLKYIAAHEHQLERAIEQFEDSAADAGLMETWMQFGAANTLDRILEELELNATMSETEVLGRALEVDARLIALYQELAGVSSVPRVTQLFDGLTSMQEARARQLARAIR